MKTRLLAIVLWSCVCFACSSPSSTVPLVYNSTFPKDTTVALEKVPMVPAQINPRCMLLSNGKILVRTSTPDNAIYSVFSYPEMKHLSYFGDRSEYIVPLGQTNNDLYLVRSDSLFTYRWVEGDSLRQFSASYFYNVMGQQMLGVTKLKENLYAYPSNYYDRGIDEFFIVNLSKEEKMPKGAYPNSPAGFNSISDFKSAYAHGTIAKPDGSRLLVFYGRTRRCHIYDMEGVLLDDILLNYAPCQNVIDTDMKKRFTHIQDAFVTDNAIYLLCPSTKDENSSSNLLVITWDGKFKAQYHMDQHISFFFVDESSNRFCGVNPYDPHHFYLFELDKNS